MAGGALGASAGAIDLELGGQGGEAWRPVYLNLAAFYNSFERLRATGWARLGWRATDRLRLSAVYEYIGYIDAEDTTNILPSHLGMLELELRLAKP